MQLFSLVWAKRSLQTHGLNLRTPLTVFRPPKPTFKCIQTLCQGTWQELKEDIAHTISSFCFSSKHLQQLHARAISFSLHHNLYICSLLISSYCTFGHFETARRIFDDQISKPSKTLLWNSLMRGYFKNQRPKSVIQIYHEMMESPAECMPDNQTFNLVITACTNLSEFELGSQIHAHARNTGLQFDILVGTALISMYCKAGDLERGRLLFDGMPVRDVVSWNAMIAGYAQQGSLPEVLRLFRSMRLVQGIRPTEATIVSLASVCGALGSLQDGEAIHAHAVKIGFGADQFVCNSLMEMYIKCNHLNSAFILFNGMILKDAVSWSTMIGGYVRSRHSSDALKLFDKMILTTRILPTRPILLNVLLACSDLGDWRRGERISKDYIKCSGNQFESDACLITLLIYMYAKCGKMETSLQLLEGISAEREEVIAWNAVIKACSELGRVGTASIFLLEMQRRGINPDPVTFLTLLPLFSSTALLRKGMEAHTHVIKRGFELERSIAHSLMDMYAKCGSIEDSRDIFNAIPDKDVISWSLIIKGYGWNGNGNEAVDLFRLMKETGTRPNHITFVAILTACSHAGFVEEGRKAFKSMKEEYELEPAMEHYACMVGLLCRAGLLSEAYLLMENMGIKACNSAILWGTLLNACREEDNLVFGEEAARHLFFLEPKSAANYIMLAKIYVSAGRADDANGVLRLLREKGLAKNPGYSWLEGGQSLFDIFG
ncbi:pentatricopeptide repeat-containing protein At3g16610-like [Magnolia sinica]|uniref:pentatricopeptide repeat-containing protein At3g16610-like n=1 Tax=Magnolia sinica TaxID=86752 RepID=UPI00265A302D|nr:pentatricopeptide repeat-containing protein At3g16610-like [Magnolia sinica]